MIPLKRRQSLVSHLQKVEVASIGELARLLAVSPMTVRRDVQHLEAAGRVISVSGGVAIAASIQREPSHLAKRQMMRAEKEAIAAAADGLVSGASSIYLDAGTTTLALARRLAARNDLPDDMLVVTNDLMITLHLAEHSRFRLYHTGGMVARENRSCVGDNAARAIQELNLDLAFLSTPSWNLRWLSIPDADKTPVKKAAVASARRRILLADSGKYGKIGAFKAVPMSAIDQVVTDDGLAKAARDALREEGIDLLIARRGRAVARKN